MDFFGIVGLRVKTHCAEQSIMLVSGVCSQCYEAFVDEVNDALLRVANFESIVLLGDFNAHVGTDNETWKGVIGRHRIADANKNGLCLLQLCSRNGLSIINTFFQH